MIETAIGLLALAGTILLPLVVTTAVARQGQRPCTTGRHQHRGAGSR